MIGGTGQPMNLQRVALASVMLVFLGMLNVSTESAIQLENRDSIGKCTSSDLT